MNQQPAAAVVIPHYLRTACCCGCYTPLFVKQSMGGCRPHAFLTTTYLGLVRQSCRVFARGNGFVVLHLGLPLLPGLLPCLKPAVRISKQGRRRDTPPPQTTHTASYS